MFVERSTFDKIFDPIVLIYSIFLFIFAFYERGLGGMIYVGLGFVLILLIKIKDGLNNGS